MSKHIRKIYEKIDTMAKEQAHVVEATPSKVLIQKRVPAPKEDKDPIVEYVKYIRKLREQSNANA
jgi:hypothetical protein